MKSKLNADSTTCLRMDWRTYQRSSKRKVTGKKVMNRCACLVVISILVWGLARFTGFSLYASDSPVPHDPSGESHANLPASSEEESLMDDSFLLAAKQNRTVSAKVEKRPHLVDKHYLQATIPDTILSNLPRKHFDTVLDGIPVSVDTSIDPALQQFLIERLKGSISLDTGIVAMEPATGRILAMVGFDRRGAERNPCVDNAFPAASVFKIVTATAAIETRGYYPDKELTFDGGKYTLHKSQIKDKISRYSNRITFKDSFAQSVNPVFGKIGSLQLGPKVLSTYATAFGFNQQLDFEIQLPPSGISVEGDPFRLAEIASGYNRETTLSPVHGALIASAILNQGRMPMPSIVDRITDKNGQLLYEGRPSSFRKSLSADASEKLFQLMQGTILSGTGRKSFRGFQHDQVLSKLYIGGKTGTMDSRVLGAHIDWFVGFAEEKNGNGALAVAVVVAHQKLIGTKAGQYARMTMEHYFREYFSRLHSVRAGARG
jgi:penicillin-binding protein A